MTDYAPGLYTVDDGLGLNPDIEITPDLLRSEAARLDATPAAGAGSVLLGQMASLLRRTAAHLDALAVERDDTRTINETDEPRGLRPAVEYWRARAEEFERQNDELHDDLIRTMNERREIALAVCAEFMPGPDGQDDIDRARVVDRIIAEGFDSGRDAVDSYRDLLGELSTRLARVEIERDALRSALTEAIDAFDECTGDYAKELAADDLARWRALVGPAVPAPMQAQAPPWSEFHDPDAERETT